MTRLLTFIILFLSYSAWPQSDEQILSDKFRPLIFQLEKSLSSSLKERLALPYPNEILSIQVKLTINPSIISKRLGISLKKSKFALPGLDDSKEIANDKILQFDPTMSDVVTVINKMDASITTSEPLNVTQTSDIKQIIDSEVSTLGIKNVVVNFTVSSFFKNKESIETKNTKDDKKAAPDFTLPVVIIASGLIMALVISVFMHQGMKRIENNLKEINNGLANLASTTPTQRSEGPTPSQDYGQVSSTHAAVNEEDLNLKLQKIIHQSSARVSDYFQHILDIQDPAKMLVLMELVRDEERISLLAKMPVGFKEDYDLFLNKIQTKTNGDEILNLAMRDMLRDFKLLPHDENFLVKKGIKYKINQINKEDIPKVIENSDENEFSYLLEVIEPVTLASTLALNPALLNKYSKISTEKLDINKLKKLSDKLTHYCEKSKLKSSSDLALFLTPELEAEFNKKTGKSHNSWETFSDREFAELDIFVRSLNVNELSSFIAILPESLKEHIMGRLPDIKAQQIQRLGIKLTDESFKLKHEFFAKNSKGAVQ